MSDPTPTGGVPSGNRTIMLVLSYLGILALIPLLVEKGDREVQWHAKHGLVLFAAEVLLFIALGFVLTIVGMIPFIGWLITLLGCLVWTILPIGILVFHVLCIVKAVNGQRMIIPGLSMYADRF
jgi:uncharacterized membrane protein